MSKTSIKNIKWRKSYPKYWVYLHGHYKNQKATYKYIEVRKYTRSFECECREEGGPLARKFLSLQKLQWGGGESSENQYIQYHFTDHSGSD